MVYCFIRLNQQAEALQKAIVLSKPTISEHCWSMQTKRVLCHIGLVRDHGGHLVN